MNPAGTSTPPRSKRFTPRLVLLAYLALLVLSIPWYLPAGTAERLVAGFPLWCLISLACYGAAALLTVLKIDDIWRAEEDEA